MCTDNDTIDLLANDTLVEVFKDEWYSLLCDAHCHAHDDTQRLEDIPGLRTGHITLMSVRQDDWETVIKVTNTFNETADPPRCIPCFGIHPWYTWRVRADSEDKEDHYGKVLYGPDDDEKRTLISQLPPPIPFTDWFNQLDQQLERYPLAMVGEVGLDRSARLLPGGAIEWHGVKPTNVTCRIEHQCAILEYQLRLAIKHDRAVSVHCVQSQGHLLTLLHDLDKKKIQPPTRICLHSFGGKPASLDQFIKLAHVHVYVSFSVAINARLGWNKLCKLIQSVPDHRLLLESDLNSPQGLDHAMVRMACLVAHAKSWSLHDTVVKTRQNWITFTHSS